MCYAEVTNACLLRVTGALYVGRSTSSNRQPKTYLLIGQPARRVQNSSVNTNIRRPTLFDNNERRRNNPGSFAGSPDFTKITGAETGEGFRRLY